MAARADLDGVPRKLFLCHAFCELGATDFVQELTRIREFLDDHTREVVIMIIQDEGPAPVTLPRRSIKPACPTW